MAQDEHRHPAARTVPALPPSVRTQRVPPWRPSPVQEATATEVRARMLVAADNRAVLGQIAAAVAGDPTIDVTHVTTPARAAQLVEARQHFDLIVADADMVPAGGCVLARDVKALGEMGWDVPPVLLLVARSQDAWIADWSGADAWIHKPADPFDLAETMWALVERRAVMALPGVGIGGGPMGREARGIEAENADTPTGGVTGGGP